jgi:hypothetical protein
MKASSNLAYIIGGTIVSWTSELLDGGIWTLPTVTIQYPGQSSLVFPPKCSTYEYFRRVKLTKPSFENAQRLVSEYKIQAINPNQTELEV